MFKVVPDQLRISDGWVRCGQCGEIFDASQNLIPDPSAEKPTPPRDPDLISAVASPEGPASDIAWVATVAPEEDASVEEKLAPELAPSSAPAPLAPAAAKQEDGADISFMRGGKKNTLWQRPMVRIILLLLAVLLLAAFVAQVLVHERDRIGSIEPSTRPLLLALCAWTGCRLSPLRQIESIAIESSSFTLVRADNYKLSFALKNNAPLDLAMPAIELSLTDAQDQAVIRRVIPPAEFGAASRPLAAVSDWNGALSLGVKSSAGSERIAGYRLLAFYP